MKNNIVEENNRQQLFDAIDEIPDAIIIWDKNLEFVDCNNVYRHLHADLQHLLGPGLRFEDLIRARAFSGRFPEAQGYEEEWVDMQIQLLTSVEENYEFNIGEKWYRLVRKLLDNGNYLSYQTDITQEKTRELQLAESENQYRALFELCPDAVFIHNSITLLFANPAFVKLLNKPSVADVIGQPAFAHNSPAYRPQVEERIRNILASGITAERNEQEYVRDDGTHVEIESQATRIFFKGEKAVLVIARDITERKNRQRELKDANEHLEQLVAERTHRLTLEMEERHLTVAALNKSRARFQEISESASEWIWEVDADFRYTYLSERAGKIYGWGKDYPIGKTRLELIQAGDWVIDPQAFEEQQEKMARHEVFENINYSIINKIGKKYFTQISGKPIFDEAGEFKGYRGTGSDITAKKVIEKALQENEKITRVFLNAAVDRAILLDREGLVLDANDAVLRVHNKPIEDILGKDIFELSLLLENSDHDLIKSRRKKLQEVVRSGEVSVLIEQFESEWCELNFSPILDETGFVTSVAVFAKDISQHKKIEAMLRKASDDANLANRSKSEFLANMSHELRSPLTAILGFTETMLHEVFGPVENARYLEYLDNIFVSGSHLHELINDILDVSAIEAGRLDTVNEEIDVADLVSASIRLLSPRAAKSTVEITYDVEKNLPYINGDERRLKQVLVNLLGNALKFTRADETIKFSAQRFEGGLLMSVKDTGIGMDAAGIEQALTKFGQVESDHSRQFEGTGLGLPLSVGLIEKHDGKLTIESELDVGTTVNVFLPAERLIEP